MCRLLMTSLKGRRLFIVQNHVHKIFNFGHIIWRKKLNFLYNNMYVVILRFLIFVKFCKNYLLNKMQRIEQNKKKKFFDVFGKGCHSFISKYLD